MQSVTEYHQSCTVEVFDLNRQQVVKSSSQPKLMLCMICSSPASVKVTRDMGSITKVEYYCKICCGN